MTLQEAIEQLVNLGSSDPKEIAAQVRQRYDDKWLSLELLNSADIILPDLARHVIGNRRRSSLALSKVSGFDKRDVMLQAAWLPGIGWMEFGKFTVEHWTALGGRYRNGAAALTRYAEWCESNAALMHTQNVAEFRQVKGALPALPPIEEAA